MGKLRFSPFFWEKNNILSSLGKKSVLFSCWEKIRISHISFSLFLLSISHFLTSSSFPLSPLLPQPADEGV
jgi:hypothetical protein